MNKKVATTYGYKCYDENGTLIGYEGGYSDNGFVFLDLDAKDNEVCYIPECSFEMGEMIPAVTEMYEEQAEINTFEDIVYIVQDELDDVSEKDARKIARFLLTIADWASIMTYICELDEEQIEAILA